ncbi:AmmeMemoRadiSam system protein B [Sediminispirochaeta smaragdinae]|uniref:AmmeMemoRadiSam system protein B n=1 Tax=Sediminispirochaeta smaragdinae (strain DSM 11293 / JCM 15392 / SEBR 4228) TaxID=573413 RepID=E1RAP8_SEDSS|nr:AmmeMemoRadiSam system protein B [Sediminispirochaeta smaragdinae]ADK82416.1 conserved hypothetical protein [Sediminispirochaeta smaragdinae DSM 11293]
MKKALAAALLFLFGCAAAFPLKSDDFYLSWDLRGEHIPLFGFQPKESSLPADAKPVAGIVSHHLLAGQLIDQWFRTLAGCREVDRFFMLSPRHWDLGSGPYSLTDADWHTASGIVSSDRDMISDLATELGVEIDPEVFVTEHGIGTFMPFIARYFPHATVVAIAYPGEPPVNMPMAEKLWAVMKRALFEKRANGTDKNFLLISTDFAHHGDLETVMKKDQRTRRFLDDPKSDTWIFGGCDNRPGMYILGKMADMLTRPRISVLYHSNSFALSGKDPQDITSYFFAYLYEASDEDSCSGPSGR